MSDNIEVRLAEEKDAPIVGKLVNRLLKELFPDKYSSFDPNRHIAAAEKLIKPDSKVWALLAANASGEFIGVVTLNECAAIYEEGAFGEISELYIAPEYRSAGVGTKLLDAAAEFGRNREWPVIEVGAPDVPRWQRTVDFYLKNNYVEIGPRLEIIL